MGWLSAGFYPTGPYEFHVGTSTDSAQATLGNTNAYLAPWFGDIAELIIYQGQLTRADRTAVESYLEDKYGTGIPKLQITASDAQRRHLVACCPWHRSGRLVRAAKHH